MSAECPEPGPHLPFLGSGEHTRTSEADQCSPLIKPGPWSLPTWRAYVAAAVLCYINMLNYMNWFIIAGEEGDSILGNLPALLVARRGMRRGN